MALGINTNVASINAQNQLSKSQGQNDQALERLSSGLRINSAADDAAGLAISTRFESQIGGQQVASRNASDGISLAQTAEGALDEITNNLQRVRELAVQSANATNNASDRQALDDEVQQRLEEIDRIASETDFNGLNVLDGSLGGQDFQVGANVGQTIQVNLEDGARTRDLGALADGELQLDGERFTDEGVLDGDVSFDISVGDGDAVTINAQEGDTVADIEERISEANIEGVTTVSVANEQELTFDDQFDVATGETDDIVFNVEGEETTLTFEGGTSAAETFTRQDVVDRINDEVGGLSAEVAATDGGTATGIQITADDGQTFTITTDDTEAFTAAEIEDPLAGQVTVQANDELTVANDDGDDAFDFGGDEEATFALEGSLDDVDVTSVVNANDAISRADAALDSVNSIRSELGAVQNRFDSTIANLDNSVENLSAANSRIRDADFAAESANLSQSQVLQQAGISVLAQANGRPQQVLSLLQ